jgi:hypothetical protein
MDVVLAEFVQPVPTRAAGAANDTINPCRVGVAKLLIIPTDQYSRGERIWRVILGEGPYSARDNAELMQGMDETTASAQSASLQTMSQESNQRQVDTYRVSRSAGRNVSA